MMTIHDTSRRLPLLMAASILAAGCASAPAPSTKPSEVGEARPNSGILKGYLDPKTLPDSLALVPPPPAAGSPAAAADLDYYESLKPLRGTARGALAAADAELRFPAAAKTFQCATGIAISETATPHLNMLLRRTLADAGLSTYRAKDHYQRVRPFVARKGASCSPSDEPRLARDGSYPSGHAALGWAWSLVLAEVVPSRADAILQRGYAFGESRLICGVHWRSDVDAGRVMGAAAVARLHTDPVFQAQLLAAKQEAAAFAARGAPPAEDCAAEAAALRARP